MTVAGQGHGVAVDHGLFVHRMAGAQAERGEVHGFELGLVVREDRRHFKVRAFFLQVGRAFQGGAGGEVQSAVGQSHRVAIGLDTLQHDLIVGDRVQFFLRTQYHAPAVIDDAELERHRVAVGVGELEVGRCHLQGGAEVEHHRGVGRHVLLVIQRIGEEQRRVAGFRCAQIRHVGVVAAVVTAAAEQGRRRGQCY